MRDLFAPLSELFDQFEFDQLHHVAVAGAGREADNRGVFAVRDRLAGRHDLRQAALAVVQGARH